MFFDVQVLNPCTPTYRNVTLKSCYIRVEREKQRKFDEWIREVEFGSFSPLIFQHQEDMAQLHKLFIRG